MAAYRGVMTSLRSRVVGGEKISMKNAKGLRGVSHKRRRMSVSTGRESNAFANLRQATLQESFSTQTMLQRLRPRGQQKNYRDESTIIQENISPDRRNSVIVLKKVDQLDGQKVPIYKRIRQSEEMAKDKDEIYNFKFSSDDSVEKLTNKKRKKIVKRRAVKRAKGNQDAKQTKKTTTAVKSEAPKRSARVKNVNKPAESVVVEQTEERAKPKTSREEKRGESRQRQPPRVPPIENVRNIEPETTTGSETPRKANEKPKVISIQTLEPGNNIEVSAAPKRSALSISNQRVAHLSKPEPTERYSNMLNDSLLNKSLSPISKALGSFDAASPWRPPTLNTFSRVKQIYQSTPYVSKHSSNIDKQITHLGGNRKAVLQNRTNDVVGENETKSLQSKDLQVTSSPRKDGSFARKLRAFGTDISNVNSPTQPKLIPNTSATETQSSFVDQEARGESAWSNSARTSNAVDSLVFDDNAENKENAKPSFQSPTGVTSRNAVDRIGSPSKKKRLAKRVPVNAEKESFEPQPGPSGLQKSVLPRESRILRQSNLNDFLNLEDMPESTTISTAHGIFGDVESTPISTKTLKKPQRDLDVENAFGFDEESLDADECPTLENVQKTFTKPVPQLQSKVDRKKPEISRRNGIRPAKKAPLDTAARLPSIVTTRTLTRPEARETDEENDQKMRKEEARKLEDVREEAKERDKKVLTNIVNFSDTFDVMSESQGLTDNEAPSEVGLFADLEPVHFTKPPARFYKRKRVNKYSFSEDDDEGGEDHHRPETKKKKVRKHEKEDKRVEQWVESINNTFQEIDKYDLVVE